jgi:SPP1 family predicted phage head-tail adaptor
VSMPGMMRHRVEVWREMLVSDAANQDAYGEPTATPLKIATVWANIEPLTGEEFFQNMQVQGQITHRCAMRGGIEITSRDWLTLDARRFEIVSVININERGDFLELMLREATA